MHREFFTKYYWLWKLTFFIVVWITLNTITPTIKFITTAGSTTAANNIDKFIFPGSPTNICADVKNINPLMIVPSDINKFETIKSWFF